MSNLFGSLFQHPDNQEEQNSNSNNSGNNNSDNNSNNQSNNNDYEVMEEAFGDVGKVYKGYQYLKIVNSSDVGANILDESFIDNIVFEREKDQSCIFQRSPKLDGVKYPFKYASREFGDSPRVVSKNEIVFTVVSKCSEYSIKNGKPKEWFLGEKQFLLNTEPIVTGKQIGRASCRERV